MKKWLKYSKLVLIINLLLISRPSYAQSPDEIVGKLMNEQKMFELREQYTQLKEQLSPVVHYFAQAMLSESFNTPKEGIIAIDTLLNNEIYQQQLGLNNITYLIYLKSGFLETLFQYKESSKMLESFLNDTKDFAINNDLKSNLQESLRINKIIGNFPSTSIHRNNNDVEIDYLVNKSGKGLSINIPCVINNNKTTMCFDTGNPKYSLVTEDFATKFAIKTLVDSIPMKGIGSGFAKIGIADSLSVGGISCYHPLFYIVDKITPIDTIAIEAVLGSSITNLFGEVQIFPKKKKMIFPLINTLPELSQKNLIMNNDHLFIKLNQDKKSLLMHFDTGSSFSNMNNLFFSENKDSIEQTATKDTIRLAGYGGVSHQISYKLPKLSFSLNNNNFVMKNIAVYTENVMNRGNESGCFGVDFVQKFNKVLVSYRHMFIELE
ncbi:retropepsin-like aspartic protease [Labilibaculum filiforme]|nr:retropepsin-like aspartic protease [Labilibaculum filiforme]